MLSRTPSCPVNCSRATRTSTHLWGFQSHHHCRVPVFTHTDCGTAPGAVGTCQAGPRAPDSSLGAPSPRHPAPPVHPAAEVKLSDPRKVPGTEPGPFMGGLLNLKQPTGPALLPRTLDGETEAQLSSVPGPPSRSGPAAEQETTLGLPVSGGPGDASVPPAEMRPGPPNKTGHIFHVTCLPACGPPGVRLSLRGSGTPSTPSSIVSVKCPAVWHLGALHWREGDMGPHFTPPAEAALLSGFLAQWGPNRILKAGE